MSPHDAGGGETGLCPRQENSTVRDEPLVSLGAHADVTVAKHVLIICKRKQVVGWGGGGGRCFCALALVRVVARRIS